MLAFFAFLWTVGNVFLGAIILRDGWNWFPAHIFGWPTLTMAQVIGLVTFYGLFKLKAHEWGKEYDAEQELKNQVYMTLIVLFAWGIFWLAR